MKKEIKEKFPLWVNDTDTNFDLLMSDDIDSLMCYIFQKENFNREVKFFIDVNYQKASVKENGIQKLYGVEGHHQKIENVLGLDIAIDKNIKTWDNHIAKISADDEVNTNSANINIAQNIHKGNYTKKYIVSSFITMLSYYDVDITNWSKDKLSVLCAIDSVYCPFVGNFKVQGRKNLADLGYEFLADFIMENLDHIKDLDKELNLKYGKIKVNTDGLLETNINLEKLSEIFDKEISLPTEKFESRFDFKNRIIKIGSNDNKNTIADGNTLFNFALHYKDSCFASVQA